MLARFQQGIALLLLAPLLGSAALVLAGHTALPVIFVVVVVLGYAGTLGLEFIWLAGSYAKGDALRPSPRDLLRAWWAEIFAAPAVFLWRQPFRSRLEPDNTARSEQSRGVILVHGFFCNRGIWNPWMKQLRLRGIPFVAINLEPLFCSIDDYVTLIEAAVIRIERATSQSPIIVAHSMGGLAARAWAARADNVERVARIVTIATPHHGTQLARYSRVINGRQMAVESPWLLSLRKRANPELAKRFICFWSHCDNIVFPTRNATLPGADNRHLRTTPHVRMVNHPDILAAVLAQANPSAD